MSASRSTSRHRSKNTARRGLVHAAGPLSATERRALLRRVRAAVSTPQGRQLGKLLAYANDDKRGLRIATSSDRLAVYIGLLLEQRKRWAVAFGLSRDHRLLYVRVERPGAARAPMTRKTQQRHAA